MFLYMGRLLISCLEQALISLDLIDGYCYRSTKESSVHKQAISGSKESILVSVFPDKETMEQVKEILRDSAR